MKLGIIIGVIVGVVILVIGIIVVLRLASPQALPAKPSPTVVSPTPSPVPKVTSPSPSPTAPAPSPPAPTAPPAPPVPVPTLKAGNWEFSIAGISGSGLTRTIAAQITNTNTTDANSVKAKIEVFSQQQRIQLSGQDYLTEDLGTVKAKTTVTRQVTVTLSLADGLKVVQNGARFVLTVTSDKGAETLNYDYKP